MEAKLKLISKYFILSKCESIIQLYLCMQLEKEKVGKLGPETRLKLVFDEKNILEKIDKAAKCLICS